MSENRIRIPINYIKSNKKFIVKIEETKGSMKYQYLDPSVKCYVQ